MDGSLTLLRINDLKSFLQGAWWLERHLDDLRVGQRGRLDGRAVLSPARDGLQYREDGRLMFGAHDGLAVQSYFYAFPEAGKAEVKFADGRLFHDLDLSDGTWSAKHLCGADLYVGSFNVVGPDEWRVMWRVEGPRKDLALDSTYRRAL